MSCFFFTVLIFFYVIWRLECELKRLRKKRFSVEIPGSRKKKVSEFYDFCIVHFNITIQYEPTKYAFSKLIF